MSIPTKSNYCIVNVTHWSWASANSGLFI